MALRKRKPSPDKVASAPAVDDAAASGAAEPQPSLSLDQLSQAFAGMLGRSPQEADEREPASPDASANDTDAEDFSEDDAELSSDSEPGIEIGPAVILEALLFVGLPDNRPLTARDAAELMRGVEPEEIPALVDQLNASYAEHQSAYRIVPEGAGYRLSLREEFASVRGRFFGRARQVRLSPAAIEVLAVVAYHEPLTADQVSQIRGTPSGAVLNQLVRRQLLAASRDPQAPGRAMNFRTTPRFLSLFGISSLADLPRSQDLER